MQHRRTPAPAYTKRHFQSKSHGATADEHITRPVYETNLLEGFVHSGFTGHRKTSGLKMHKIPGTGNMVCADLVKLLPKRISTDSAIGRWGAWLGIPGSSLLIIANAEGTWPSLLPWKHAIR